MYPEHQHIDTVILGGSFRACGLATRFKDACIIERSCVPGAEFSLALNPGIHWDRDDLTPHGKALKQEFLSRQALDKEGRANLAAFAPILSQQIRRLGLDYRMMTDVIRVDGNRLHLMDPAGPYDITFSHLIDLRPRQGLHLNGMIYAETPPPDALPPFRLLPSLVPHFFFASLKLSPNLSWPEARSTWYHHWIQAQKQWKTAQLVSVAEQFDTQEEDNPATAWSAGEQMPLQETRPLQELSCQEDKTDIVVVGFGTAGSCAAISAARCGAKVLVIERNTTPGGTMTSGFVSHFYLQKPIGLLAELEEKAKEFNRSLQGRDLREAYKAVRDEESRRWHLQVEFNATPENVVQEGRQVKGLTWRDSQGNPHFTRCKVIIDATAEAVVCRLAGAPVSQGRKSDGELNTFTTSFLEATEKSVRLANFDSGSINLMKREEALPTLLTAYNTHLADNYQTQTHPQLFPSFLPGIRDSIRIRSQAPETTLADLLLGNADTAEPMFIVYSNLDTHRNDFALEDELFQDWIIGASMWGTNLAIPVDRRSMLPQNIQGLLASGRHLGVNHELGYAIRMNAGMGAIGEVAGLWAALARDKDGICEEVPYAELQQRLPVSQWPALSENAKLWDLTDAQIEEGLRSETPGFAIWSIRRHHKKSLALNLLNDPSERCAWNCAIALALCNDDSGSEILRKLVQNRENFTPKTSRKKNHPYGYTALFLLGKLARPQDLPLFQEILKNPPETFAYEYQTYAIRGLIRIGESTPHLRQTIAESLRQCAENPQWHLMERLKGSQIYIPGETSFRRFIARTLDQWHLPHTIYDTLEKHPLSPDSLMREPT